MKHEVIIVSIHSLSVEFFSSHKTAIDCCLLVVVVNFATIGTYTDERWRDHLDLGCDAFKDMIGILLN